MRPFLSYELDPRWNVVAVTFSDHPSVEEDLLGRSVFSVVSDPTLALLLKSVFERVAESRGSVNVYYRCDTPTVRRRCAMIARYQHAGPGVVTVDNLFLTQERREPMALLEPMAGRSAQFVRMCSWCKKVVGSTRAWMEVEDAMNRLDELKEGPLPEVTHGMCPACSDYILTQLREQTG